ncbi:mucin-7-like [Procambarus clarkii]|uniref:mucin-7-like n=1 Tax=Procambarus clarkii TaxID=6728 RepID=UPI0037424D47
MITGTNTKEFVRILNNMYADIGLPTFTVRDELFTTTASANASSTTSATNTTSASNITISSTALADILSADAHPVQPATYSAISLHTATPDEPSTSPVVPETTPASPETTPAAPETTPASQVPTPDASVNQHLSSDDDSTASVDVEAQSPSPATEESPRVSKSLRTI